MKATISFDLLDPDDKAQHLRAIKSLDLYLALNAIQDRLRQTVKYDKDPISQDEFFEILNNYGINLEELG